MFLPQARDSRLFAAALVALLALAWLALLVWERSPYGRFLDHEELADIPLAPEGEALVFGLFFVAGWTLMTFAMMLPTSLPLIQLFRRLIRQRTDRGVLVGLLIVGYLGIWSLFGIAAHLGDWALHQLIVERSAWLDDHALLIGAGVLLVAGGYQFTPLKYMCLDKCRSPLSFITEHWRGARERAEAFQLGVHHGVFCVGCCWSLMLLMFAVGVGNVGWMLALGAVMAVEKNMPWGRRLSAPLGIGLLAGGTVLAVLSFTQEACAVHIGC